jgi:hypothetical protein
MQLGRRCGALRVHGVDVGATVIGEGLAVRFVCGATGCPTLPRRGPDTKSTFGGFDGHHRANDWSLALLVKSISSRNAREMNH